MTAAAQNSGFTSPILIVEDDRGLARLIKIRLEQHGYLCELRQSGRETIAWLAGQQATLMLLDYSLPDMTGEQLVSALRAAKNLPPFIMITGREDASIAVNMMRLGARDYVVKDINFLEHLPKAVIRVIQELIMERRLAETVNALKDSEARLAKAQHISRMGSWELNLASGEVTWSEGMYSLLGLEHRPENVLSMEELFRAVHPDDQEFVRAAIAILRETRKPFCHDFRMNTADGREVMVNAQADLELSADGTPLLISGTVLDITERKQAELEIQHLAFYDTLTLLPNRTLLHDRLAQAISQAARDGRTVSVLFLDLDRFKSINDSMGHATGDRLLKGVAERLQHCVRESDTVARLGGDEFVIVLSAVNHEEDVTGIAEKVMSCLSTPIQLDEQEVFTTASIGIALYPMDGADVSTLLKNADIAMYQAKEQGRNNYQYFSREMNVKAVEYLMLETSLRRALEREEFFLVYQPQVDLKSGRMTGVEALLRWQHPDLGLLFPSRFIPIAEETGMILPIGEWVLKVACVQNRKWQEMGLPPFRMAVNISARQFKQNELSSIVATVLRRTGLHPAWLELELTESTIMSKAEETIRILRSLKEMGVSLAIDDFGTGYSSLSYLKHFPIDRVKIDRSFVCDITDNPDDAAIAEAIIAMAHSLKLTVTAEGVEREEQKGYLSTRNCDEYQGFLISRPLPAEELTPLLQQFVAKTPEIL